MRWCVVPAVIVISLVVAGAKGATVTVTPSSPAGWYNPPGENNMGGSSAITSTAPHLTTGSVELFGGRTRFVLGSIYYFSGVPSLGLLDDVNSFHFDWSIAVGSTNPYHPDYTPALRLHIWDPTLGQRSELIWEGAYNGTYGATTKGVWYTSSDADKFWRWQAGAGETLIGGALGLMKVSDWAASSFYSPEAFVMGISVGAGSGATSAYHAFADMVTYNGTTYNFETAVIPLPAAAWTGLALFGVLGIAKGLRRRLA